MLPLLEGINYVKQSVVLCQKMKNCSQSIISSDDKMCDVKHVAIGFSDVVDIANTLNWLVHDNHVNNK